MGLGLVARSLEQRSDADYWAVSAVAEMVVVLCWLGLESLVAWFGDGYWAEPNRRDLVEYCFQLHDS